MQKLDLPYYHIYMYNYILQKYNANIIMKEEENDRKDRWIKEVFQ
jgi:hypothetical protein